MLHLKVVQGGEMAWFVSRYISFLSQRHTNGENHDDDLEGQVSTLEHVEGTIPGSFCSERLCFSLPVIWCSGIASKAIKSLFKLQKELSASALFEVEEFADDEFHHMKPMVVHPRWTKCEDFPDLYQEKIGVWIDDVLQDWNGDVEYHVGFTRGGVTKFVITVETMEEAKVAYNVFSSRFGGPNKDESRHDGQKPVATPAGVLTSSSSAHLDSGSGKFMSPNHNFTCPLYLCLEKIYYP